MWPSPFLHASELVLNFTFECVCVRVSVCGMVYVRACGYGGQRSALAICIILYLVDRSACILRQVLTLTH